MKPIASIHSLRSDRKVMSVVQDTSHPAIHLFQPLPSGRRYRAMRARTSRLQNSFYAQVCVCACVRAGGWMWVWVLFWWCGWVYTSNYVRWCMSVLLFMFVCLPLPRHFLCCKTWWITRIWISESESESLVVAPCLTIFTRTGRWWLSHQCTSLSPCCFLEWEAWSLTLFYLLAILDSAFPSFLAGVSHRDTEIGLGSFTTPWFAWALSAGILAVLSPLLDPWLTM